jgi:hypothetical protein
VIGDWDWGKKNGVTGTVVHAPRNIRSLFEIPAAWDTGACHLIFLGSSEEFVGRFRLGQLAK